MIRRVVRVLVYEGEPDWVAAALRRIAIPDGTTQYFVRDNLIRATRVEDVIIDSGPNDEIIVEPFEEPRT